MELNLTRHQTAPSTGKTLKSGAKSVAGSVLTYSPAHFAANQSQGDVLRKNANAWVLALVLILHMAILAYWLMHVSKKPEPIPEVPIEVSLLNEIPQAPVIKPEPIIKPQPQVQKPKPAPQQTKLNSLPVSETPTAQPLANESKVNNPVPELSREQANAATKPVESKVAPELEKPAPKEDVIEPPKFGVAYLNNPKPNYPNLSRRTGERGRVLLKVLVDANGLPATVELGAGSGFERLDNAALEAVKQWKFVPARKNNQAISAWVTVPISFALD